MKEMNALHSRIRRLNAAVRRHPERTDKGTRALLIEYRGIYEESEKEKRDNIE